MKDQKVLVIEDNQRYSQQIVDGFKAMGAVVDTAFTIDDANNTLFCDGLGTNHYDIIVVDACVPGDDYNTKLIIKRLVRFGFKGVLVAASSFGKFREEQIKDGCTINGGPDKAKIPQVVSAMLAPTTQ